MAVHHARQEPAAQVHHRRHVDLDQVDLLLGNGFGDEPECREAGVVDQDVGHQPEGRDAVWQRRPFGPL